MSSRHGVHLTHVVVDLLADAPSIRSSTAKGKVVLDGNAKSMFERFDAVEDAASVPGVTEVVDNLTVERSPEVVKSAIEDRLFWDAAVQRDRVLVTMAPDGAPTLTGTLDSEAEIHAAVDDAMLGGAPHLVNLLHCKGRAAH